MIEIKLSELLVFLTYSFLWLTFVFAIPDFLINYSLRKRTIFCGSVTALLLLFSLFRFVIYVYERGVSFVY